MRIVQRAFLYVISIAIIAAGVAIAAYPFSGQVVEIAHTIAGKWMLCVLVGCAAAALGVFTLLPFDLFGRKGRSISFSAPSGTVSIQIEPFEISLRKTIAKLPMVKRASVCVTPKDNDRKVGIEATVSLKKPADASTRETAERLREFIDKVSRQILGADEVTTVDVRIEDVLIDSTQTAESLNGIFAAAEKKVAPVERSFTPAAVLPAGPVAISSPAAEHDDDYGHEEDVDEESDTHAEETHDESHSSDLLTYDEADELQHARWSGPDAEESAETSDESGPDETSFDSLNETAEKDEGTKPETNM